MALILRCKPPSFCGFCNCKVILEKFHIVNLEIVNSQRFQIFFMDMYKMDNIANVTQHTRSQIHKIQYVICAAFMKT